MSKELIGGLVDLAYMVGGCVLIGYQTNWKVGLGLFFVAVAVKHD